jgi:hypothetical protein
MGFRIFVSLAADGLCSCWLTGMRGGLASVFFFLVSPCWSRLFHLVQAHAPRVDAVRLRESRLPLHSMPTNQTHECAEHVIELPSELVIDLADIPKSRSNLEASQRLPQRAKCCVIASDTIAASVVAALGDISAAHWTMPGGIDEQDQIAPFDMANHRPNPTNQLKKHSVNSQHQNLPAPPIGGTIKKPSDPSIHAHAHAHSSPEADRCTL